MSAGRAVWEDGCFRIENDAGTFWVTELLHDQQRDVPHRWRIRFDTSEGARQWIGARLRQGHDRLYHSHVPAEVAG